jgi:hypothetical protein
MCGLQDVVDVERNDKVMIQMMMHLIKYAKLYPISNVILQVLDQLRRSIMRVVTTFHPPSAVLCSLKCKLSIAEADVEHLVVAKVDRIDVYACRPGGLHHECGREFLGRILAVKAIPLKVSQPARSVSLCNRACLIA